MLDPVMEANEELPLNPEMVWKKGGRRHTDKQEKEREKNREERKRGGRK